MKHTHLLSRPLIAAMVMTALAAFALSGCDDSKAGPAVPVQAGPPITAATVIERSISETQEFSGRL